MSGPELMLAELISEWRRRVTAIGRDVGSYRQCADELEVALSAALQPAPAVGEREAELVKALEPFAKVGRLIDGQFGPALFANDDDAFQSGCAWTEDGERKTLTWGNFRAARAAINPSLEQE